MTRGNILGSRWIVAVMALILVAVAGGAWWIYKRETTKAAPVKAAQAVPDVGPQISVEGTIQALNTIAIAAPISGKVDGFYVEVGQDVSEGQLMAQIKSETLDAAQQRALEELERAQTRLNNLESEFASARLEASRARADASRARSESDRLEKVFARQKMLIAEGATPRLVFEKAQKDYNTARSESDGLETVATQAEERVSAMQKEMDAAKKTLDDKNSDLEEAKAELAAGEVHSPVDGVVTGRRGAAGDDVDPSVTDLFNIATDLSTLVVTIEPPPPALAKIKPGMPATVTVAENPAGPMPGQVKEIKGTQVIVEFANPSPVVRPGLTAQVTVKLT